MNHLKPPINYIPNFIKNPDEAFKTLSEELAWERRDNTPRLEYYCNDFPKDYVYGVGRGKRLYSPQPWHQAIKSIRAAVEEEIHSTLEVCFLNRYLNQRDQLGWHADDSPEMDDNRPIGIVSLGVEREIWFRPVLRDWAKSATTVRYGEVTKLKLGHGSLCIMGVGMQDNWQHRIPKASFECGERISLTFRGYIEQA